MDFLRHVYKYFKDKPCLPDKNNPQPTSNDADSLLSLENLIPVYSEDGLLVKYIEAPGGRKKRKLKSVSVKTPTKKLKRHSATSRHAMTNERMYRKTEDGNFVLAKSTTSSESGSNSEDSDESNHNGDNINPVEWDGWPSGNWSRNFTWEEFEAAGKLRVHWATETGGGSRGSEKSGNWRGGRKLTRKCLGVMKCKDPLCRMLVRPQTREDGRARQLKQPCKCGQELLWEECGSMASLYTWKGGIHYVNEGDHPHQRPTHILSILPGERQRFETLVAANPKSGPLQLIVGVPTLQGPGESVTKISPIFHNADRVSKERQKLVKGSSVSQTADGLIASFTKFSQDHPGFVIHSTLGEITVISVQTKFMRSRLIHKKLKGPINGLVNDASHSWWSDRNALLMISSIYCPTLLCWVPGVISYTNGASAPHFAEHFTAVLQSIAFEAELQEVEVNDELFAGVMDFSQAERSGFITAFIAFWITRPNNTRTQAELEAAAECLLKGCQEHFRAQITRISRISAVIPISRAEEFIARASALLFATTSKDFITHASYLVKDFPAIQSWIEWWMRPSIASMLFQSKRVMEPELWNMLPATTNAQESMHWKMFRMCGGNHQFLEGMYSLYGVAVHYEEKFEDTIKGTLTNYAPRQYWQVLAKRHGRTKPSRAPKPEDVKRSKNDGRPPDTTKELIRQPKKGVVTAIQPSIYPPLYPWTRNSCWLDTSLQLLYVALTQDIDNLKCLLSMFAKGQSGSLLKVILQHLHDRYSLGALASSKLRSQRDDIRRALKKKLIIKTLSACEPLFVWFFVLLQLEETSQTFRPVLAFEVTMIQFKECTGCKKTGGPHIEITHQPSRHRIFQLTPSHHEKYNGHFLDFFNDFISIHRPKHQANTCWRYKDGTSLCSGIRHDSRDLVVSMPILFTLDIASEKGESSEQWNFPATLASQDPDDNLIYDIAGFALINKAQDHFTARYASQDRQKIFTYNDLEHKGAPYEEEDGKIETHLSGPDVQLPVGFSIYQVFYLLRGGLAAQEQFFKKRQQDLSHHIPGLVFSSPKGDLLSLFSVTYKSKDYTKMPTSNRTWLHNPFKSHTTEYLSTSATFLIDTFDADSDVSEPQPESEEEADTTTTRMLPKKPAVVNPASNPPYLEIDSNESLPLSAFGVDCRCGASGDGNLFYEANLYGKAICCDTCNNWSHMACQRLGRASNMPEKTPFLCDGCNLELLFPHTKEKERLILMDELRAEHSLPLDSRLRAGCGALARHGSGVYYYPVRLINKIGENCWLVSWWRDNQYLPGVQSPAQISTVSTKDLVDALWMDQKSRRSIRLGKWTHACDITTAEDILSNPSSIPYSEDVNVALSPYKDLLQNLCAYNLDSLDRTKVPALAWLEKQRKLVSARQTIIPFVGHLSITERAQVANWVDIHVTEKDPKRRLDWLGGRLPIAHAYTVYIAHLISRDADPPYRVDDNSLTRDAWNVQVAGLKRPSRFGIDIDVDAECLYSFEETMLTVSATAGVAGFHQWGLDAGHHQDNWNPYAGLPETWVSSDFNLDDEGSESALEKGPLYVEYQQPDAEPIKKQPRVQPRRRGRSSRR